jgi:transposase
MKKRSTRDLKIVNPDAAGIDIGSDRHYVAIPDDRGGRPIENFGCVTSELERMANWLLACRIKTVALESTGVYWIPVCDVLEDHGIEVVMVDPRQVKNFKGHKTDVLDAALIQKFHSLGLLTGSFRPKAEMQAIRDLWRFRDHLIKDGARQIHIMQKSLEQMNVQLHKVISDITGLSGLRILRAIVRGVRDPKELAKLPTRGIKASTEDIEEALRGHYREQHVFALTQALSIYDFLRERIHDCDVAVERLMSALPGERRDPPRPKRDQRYKNHPEFDLATEQIRITGVDLTRIPCVNALTIQTVITECGVSPSSSFPTEHHFASWLCLAPNNKKTCGRVFSTKTRFRPSASAIALRVAAMSLQRSKTPLGDRFRSLKARIGMPKAITAMAHRLAKLIYRGLTRGQEYLDIGLHNLDAQTAANKVRALERRAKYLGFQLAPLSQPAP